MFSKVVHIAGSLACAGITALIGGKPGQARLSLLCPCSFGAVSGTCWAMSFNPLSIRFLTDKPNSSVLLKEAGLFFMQHFRYQIRVFI